MSDPQIREGAAPTFNQPPVSYTIDVCVHCGRLAVWPGCEHWQRHDNWTTAIRVVPKIEDRNMLRVLMNREDREP